MRLSPQLLLMAVGLTSLSGAVSTPGAGLQQVVQALGQSVDSVADAWRPVAGVDTENMKEHHKDKKKHKKHKHKKENHSKKPLSGERIRRKMKKAGIIPSGQ